jgi:hypothetical protein
MVVNLVRFASATGPQMTAGVARSVRSVTHASGAGQAKYWSEWQDLNLRPPRPERGALPTTR